MRVAFLKERSRYRPPPYVDFPLVSSANAVKIGSFLLPLAFFEKKEFHFLTFKLKLGIGIL